MNNPLDNWTESDNNRMDACNRDAEQTFWHTSESDIAKAAGEYVSDPCEALAELVEIVSQHKLISAKEKDADERVLLNHRLINKLRNRIESIFADYIEEEAEKRFNNPAEYYGD